ncbi:MAG TPA: hypothetical protein VGJ20_05420 [Xanthobacteraceae bacterium]
MGDDRLPSREADGSAQVLRFRQRPRVGRVAPPPAAKSHDLESEPFDDLAQYEEEDTYVDYRHRMLMNVIAAVVVVLLVVFGVWIADVITDMERDQDCLMQGRQNCGPIEVPAQNLQ